MSCQSDEIADFVTETYPTAVDTIFCFYTAWQTMEALEHIQTATEGTVITSNQATIKATLGALGCL